MKLVQVSEQEQHCISARAGCNSLNVLTRQILLRASVSYQGLTGQILLRPSMSYRGLTGQILLRASVSCRVRFTSCDPTVHSEIISCFILESF